MTSVPSLVTIENNIPLADSRQIAHELGIEHRSFFKMIAEYQQEIEEDFGKVRILIAPSGKTKQPLKYASLTEDQTYAYLAYSQNTPQARACKRKLIKAFSEMRAFLTSQPAPTHAIPLRPDIATFVDVENTPERWTHIINVFTMLMDVWESGADLPYVKDYLWQQFNAEYDALTPEEDAWGSPPQVIIKRPQRRLKH